MVIYSFLPSLIYMVRMKLTARKHVRAPPHRNNVPTESHSDGQNVGYFPRTLWTMLLALGSSEPPLFIGTPRLLCGKSYPEPPLFIRQVVEAPAPRRTFEAGMREAAHEALTVLRHKADEQVAHSQYCHFPS
jgi:hypothetical protein